MTFPTECRYFLAMASGGLLVVVTIVGVLFVFSEKKKKWCTLLAFVPLSSHSCLALGASVNGFAVYLAFCDLSVG